MLEALDAAGRLPPERLEELVGDAPAAGGTAGAEEEEDGREAGRLGGDGGKWLRSPSPRWLTLPSPPKSPG